MTDKPVTAIFGLGATSLTAFSSRYLKWLKGKNKPLPELVYVGTSTNYVKGKRGRVVLIESVVVLFNNLLLLHPDDRVIIADSPLLLSEIPNIVILDIEDSAIRVGSYSVVTPSVAAFHAALIKSQKTKLDFKDLGWVRKDQLGLIVDSTASGLIASPIMALTAQLDHRARVTFRKEIAKWVTGETKLDDVIAYAKKTLAKGQLTDELIKTFHTAAKKVEADLREAVALNAQSKSLKKVTEKSGLTIFEIKFISKMTGPKAK